MHGNVGALNIAELEPTRGPSGKAYRVCIFSLTHTVTAVAPSSLADPYHVSGDEEVRLIKDDGEPRLTEPFFVVAV